VEGSDVALAVPSPDPLAAVQNANLVELQRNVIAQLLKAPNVESPVPGPRNAADLLGAKVPNVERPAPGPQNVPSQGNKARVESALENVRSLKSVQRVESALENVPDLENVQGLKNVQRVESALENDPGLGGVQSLESVQDRVPVGVASAGLDRQGEPQMLSFFSSWIS